MWRGKNYIKKRNKKKLILKLKSQVQTLIQDIEDILDDLESKIAEENKIWLTKNINLWKDKGYRCFL